MSNGRCKATHSHGGSIYRCQDIQGHTSAHYNDDMWWPNERGLPEKNGATRCMGIILWLVIAAAIVAVIVWMVRP